MKKNIFFLFCFCFLLLSCGKKVPLPELVVKQPPNWVSDYRAFYRYGILILQAKITSPEVIENFDFLKVKINVIEDGGQSANYANEFFYKKKVADTIEIALFPFKEQKFFRMVYEGSEQLVSPWKKPIYTKLLPLPKTTTIYVDYTLKSHPKVTVRFANQQNYRIRIYEKDKILPMAEFGGDIVEYILPVGVNSLLVYYYDDYGNESRAKDISNWF